MKEAKIKLGLVLAGGGAKGAYKSGVVKYLAEIDFAPLMIAGTSIGALNGAILASGTSFKQSSDRLQSWTICRIYSRSISQNR
ncbi:MAG: patatin-like phospholipase family protein [Dolichospermum sp. BR01]|nr:patatin-like phospholipase family protein [Dolichospermum sp. BR01]